MRFFIASTVSALGDGIRVVTLPLMAVSLTSDPRLVSLVIVAQLTPTLLFGPIAGALADRWNRRSVMWIVDAARASIMTLFAVVVDDHGVSVVVLAAFSFLLSTVGELYDSASDAILPDIAGSAGLERMTSRLVAGKTLSAKVIGPLLGAVLLSASPAMALLADAASFAVASVLVCTLTGDFRPTRNASRHRLVRTTVDGLRLLATHAAHRRLCILAGAVNLAVGAVVPVVALLSQQVLHLDATGYAMLTSIGAVGGVAGAFLAPIVTGRLGPTAVAWLSVLTTFVALATSASASTTVVVGAMLALFGAGIAISNIATTSFRQRAFPRELLGRATSSAQFVVACAAPLGALGGAFLADSHGLRAPFLAGAVLVLVAGMATLSTPLRWALPAGRAGNPRHSVDGVGSRLSVERLIGSMRGHNRQNCAALAHRWCRYDRRTP